MNHEDQLYVNEINQDYKEKGCTRSDEDSEKIKKISARKIALNNKINSENHPNPEFEKIEVNEKDLPLVPKELLKNLKKGSK